MAENSRSELEACLEAGKVSSGSEVITIAAETAGDVCQLFHWAAKQNCPVYVYEEPKPGGVKLELQKMNKIVEIDAANLVATVEAGINVGELAAALAAQNLRFIPAVAPFYHHLSIGEMLYQGYFNPMSLKYGPTKHMVMGTQMVLPSGERLKTGGKTVKNVTGYDMTRFLNGPYSHFGVTTTYLLKLLPVPEQRRTLTLDFAEYNAVLALVETLKQTGIVPACLLWADPVTGKMLTGGSTASHQVIMELDGVEEEVAAQHDKLLKILQAMTAVLREDTLGAGEQPGRWSQLFREQEQPVLLEELRIPYQASGDFWQRFQTWKAKQGHNAGLFGQIREGRIHVYFADGTNNADSIQELISLAQEATGCSTGRYARQQGGGGGVLGEIERRMKQAFDPQLLLNR